MVTKFLVEGVFKVVDVVDAGADVLVGCGVVCPMRGFFGVVFDAAP